MALIPSGQAVRDTIELLRKIYKIRSCNRSLPGEIGKGRPCLYHHMGQCEAPCQDYISKEKYRENISGALSFLSGNYKAVAQMLQDKMQAASEAMAFEKAIEYRDLLNSVHQIVQKQKITSSQMDDRDVIAYARPEMKLSFRYFSSEAES